jgi:hypothetical protein
MSKKELKDRNEYLEIEVANLNVLLESHKASHAKMKDERDMWVKFEHEHARRERFLETRLRRVMHMLALDTVLQRTHRDRNDVLRAIVNMIASWVSENVTDDTNMDDIPF